MKLITRNGWGARPAKNQPGSADTITTVPASSRKGIILHHTTGGSGANAAAVPALIRGHQNYAMNSKKNSDVGYNYLYDNFGNVYEGRGWDKRAAGVGASITVKNPPKGVVGGNTPNISIAYVGTDPTSAASRRAALELYAYVCGKVGKRLPVFGHRDLNATACPGAKNYAWLNGGKPFKEHQVWTITSQNNGSDKVNVRFIHTVVNHAIKLGLIGGAKLVVSDSWGDALTARVKALQKALGLTSDGIVGSASWPKFEAVLERPLPTPEPEPEAPVAPEIPVEPEVPVDPEPEIPIEPEPEPEVPVNPDPEPSWLERVLGAVKRLVELIASLFKK